MNEKNNNNNNNNNNRDSNEGKIYTFFTHKGGVGKTTMVITLLNQVCENYKGKMLRTLLVDFDPQMNLTSLVLDPSQLDLHHKKLLKEETYYKTTSDITNPPDDLEKVIYNYRTSSRFKIDIILGSFENDYINTNLSNEYLQIKQGKFGATMNVIREQLTKHKRDYDLIYVDLNPSLSSLNKTIIISGDYLISPVMSDSFSLNGLLQIKKQIYDTGLPKPQYLGFILNRVKTTKGRLNSLPRLFSDKFDKLSKEINSKSGYLGHVTETNKLAHTRNFYKIISELTSGDDVKRLKEEVKVIIDNIEERSTSKIDSPDEIDEEVEYKRNNSMLSFSRTTKGTFQLSLRDVTEEERQSLLDTGKTSKRAKKEILDYKIGNNTDLGKVVQILKERYRFKGELNNLMIDKTELTDLLNLELSDVSSFLELYDLD